MSIHPLRKRAPVLDDLVGVLLRREALLLGDARDLGGVLLVGAREEERLVAALLVMAHQDVRRDGRVRMTDVRRRVDVVDGCRQVEAHHDQ